MFVRHTQTPTQVAARTAFVDSGSDFSFISLQLAKELGVTKYDGPGFPFGTAADDARTLGSVRIRFVLGLVEFTFLFSVCDTNVVDVLLGGTSKLPRPWISVTATGHCPWRRHPPRYPSAIAYREEYLGHSFSSLAAALSSCRAPTTWSGPHLHRMCVSPAGK